MDYCNCLEPLWPPHVIYMRYQYISNFCIALAYFSILLGLIYFLKKFGVFPYRWVLLQSGAFIILCGINHVISLWTFTAYSPRILLMMTVVKVLTALVSCTSALMLVRIIPHVLNAKPRELFLKNKADELDKQMALVLTQQQNGKNAKLLTQEIRNTLDSHMILNTTLLELARALQLEECALWMPTCNGLELQLSHTLHDKKPVSMTVRSDHPTIKAILNSHRAVAISPNSPVCMVGRRAGQYMAGEVVAMRVPILQLNSFQTGYWPDPSHKLYALMVLILPFDSAQQWHSNELELVELVTEQVAVALSHAAILEESMRKHHILFEQNITLERSQKEVEAVVAAWNNFLALISLEMRVPLDGLIFFMHFLKETELRPEQRSMVETVLSCSNLLATLIDDLLDMSLLEHGILELDAHTFNLLLVFHKVLDLVKPIAAVKKLSVTFDIARDVSVYAVGDDTRLMLIILNVVGNAIKFTKEGSVMIQVCLRGQDYEWDPYSPNFCHDAGDTDFFLRVQVQDTGLGVDPSDIPGMFNKSVQGGVMASRKFYRTSLGLAICKRLVSLMDGHIWIESEGIGRGCTVTFIVKLQLAEYPKDMGELPNFMDMQILVVDCDLASQTNTCHLFNSLGYGITSASSGFEALQALSYAVGKFKLIVIDISTPYMDGIGLVVRIQEKVMMLEGPQRPLLVAVTRNLDQTSQKRCLSVGVACVVSKPLSLDKLRCAVSRLFARVPGSAKSV